MVGIVENYLVLAADGFHAYDKKLVTAARWTIGVSSYPAKRGHHDTASENQ